MNKFFKQKNKGFTVVETLVAIAILSLSITATFTAVQSGIRFSVHAKDQLTAFYLAQQAVESVKTIRDNNILYSLNSLSTGGPRRDWLYGLVNNPDPCAFGYVCQIDSLLLTAQRCGGSTAVGVSENPPNLCEYLRQNDANGLYGYESSWDVTRFKREVQLESVVVGREVRVVVTVSWTGNSGPQSFSS